MSDNISKEVEQAVKKAMNSIESCFKNEVKKESEETLYDYTSSIKDMYDGGWEDRYQLGISGAFEDRESIDSTIIREGNNIELTTYNTAKGELFDNGVNLSDIIETGQGYQWGNAPARPVFEMAEREMEVKIEDIIKKGLKKRGWDVK